MNILFVAENYPPHYGGAEVVFEATCEGLAARKHNITVVTHHPKGTPYREKRNGVNVIRVPCFGSRYFFTFIAPFWTLWHARDKDIIHTTTYNGAPPAWLAAQLLGKPVVITVHETWVGNWKKYTNMSGWKTVLHEILERPIWWLHFDKYLCVSQSTKTQLEDVLPKRLHERISVNHNGFDTSNWNAKTYAKVARDLKKEFGLQKKFIVFAYGRPGPSKGFEYLMKAIPRIRKKIKNAHFVVQLADNKQTHAKREELLSMIPKGSATILEDVPYNDMPAYALMADCWVTPSLCEGFGYTVLEANALDIPLVATNAGSIPEVISGKHVLVKPRNPQAIVDGVMQVKKKQYANTKKKQFFWKDNLNRVEKIYRELTK